MTPPAAGAGLAAGSGTADIDRLLDPWPLPLETGYQRLANGVLHVACRTDLHGCSGEMFTWWFRSRPDSRQYVWWHPVDHVSSEWLEVRDGTHVGSIHRVQESFSGPPLRQLLIQFGAPQDFFAPAALAAHADHVSTLICARGGESWQAPRDPAGRVLGSRLFHVGRDTAWGLALRSHFYLGWDLPAAGRSAEEIAALIPDAAAPGLLKHCYDEFTTLSRFLPPLFAAENRASHPVRLPW